MESFFKFKCFEFITEEVTVFFPNWEEVKMAIDDYKDEMVYNEVYKKENLEERIILNVEDDMFHAFYFDKPKQIKIGEIHVVRCKFSNPTNYLHYL